MSPQMPAAPPGVGRRRGLGGRFDEKAELLREAGTHVSVEKNAGHL
ncbi:MAG: hypothetical protein ACYS9C_14615 [Planctomycetota bacterium]|jgi:hypothetical protein